VVIREGNRRSNRMYRAARVHTACRLSVSMEVRGRPLGSEMCDDGREATAIGSKDRTLKRGTGYACAYHQEDRKWGERYGKDRIAVVQMSSLR
jgi:hypothetical protein